MSEEETVSIEEKGNLTKYDLMPKRKLHIGVYKMQGGRYFSCSNENKTELIDCLHKMYGISDIKIYSVEIGDQS